MSDAIPCPQWGAPAESTKRFWLDSTDGPIQHPKIGCLSKHWFTPRPETVQPEQVATRSAPGGATKLTDPGTAGGPGEQGGEPDS
jgi:hypothetical protein